MDMNASFGLDRRPVMTRIATRLFRFAAGCTLLLPVLALICGPGRAATGPAGSVAAQPAVRPRMAITAVRSFMYQLQNLEQPAAVEALARSDYDLLVVEPTATLDEQPHFDAKAMVARLHAGKPGRIVLAYLNAGQAESYRTYWKSTWKPPTKAHRGTPDFILIPDPDGWSDNYNVAYWDPRWQQTFATNADSEVRSAMGAGFDGVYLDWIDAYTDDRVVAAARKQHINPARAMADFLLCIRREARAINPHALVVQQNAIGLLDDDPRSLAAIDAVGVEDTWFSGRANAHWGTNGAGDIPNRARDDGSTVARLTQYARYIKAGKPVLTIDYCRNAQHAAQVYRDALAHGLVPLVTQVSLDHLTTTPPPRR
jgi:cysteinyl-tRNA synthetase, unknown class